MKAWCVCVCVIVLVAYISFVTQCLFHLRCQRPSRKRSLVWRPCCPTCCPALVKRPYTTHCESHSPRPCHPPCHPPTMPSHRWPQQASLNQLLQSILMLLTHMYWVQESNFKWFLCRGNSNWGYRSWVRNKLFPQPPCAQLIHRFWPGNSALFHCVLPLKRCYWLTSRLGLFLCVERVHVIRVTIILGLDHTWQLISMLLLNYS